MAIHCAWPKCTLRFCAGNFYPLIFNFCYVQCWDVFAARGCLPVDDGQRVPATVPTATPHAMKRVWWDASPAPALNSLLKGMSQRILHRMGRRYLGFTTQLLCSKRNKGSIDRSEFGLSFSYFHYTKIGLLA